MARIDYVLQSEGLPCGPVLHNKSRPLPSRYAQSLFRLTMPRSEPTVAVLMPVHTGVPPEHLKEAVQSLLVQTRPPDEIVIVLDGPVSQDHEATLLGLPKLRIVRMKQPSGVALALEAGLGNCVSDFVARADSDDINEPDRLQVQLDLLTRTGADVCTTAMVEFETEPRRDLGIRATPVDHADFASLMRTRNPVNHPTVVFRRSAAIAAGGYQEVLFLEDYDLWARMLMTGSTFVGVDRSLVRFRADGMHDRRTAPTLRASERILQRRFVSYGLITTPRMWVNLLIRGTYRRMPRFLLVGMYGRIFRSRS